MLTRGCGAVGLNVVTVLVCPCKKYLVEPFAVLLKAMCTYSEGICQFVFHYFITSFETCKFVSGL